MVPLHLRHNSAIINKVVSFLDQDTAGHTFDFGRSNGRPSVGFVVVDSRPLCMLEVIVTDQDSNNSDRIPMTLCPISVHG